MADTPDFVRLAHRLSRGMLADVHGSGWSIAGLDVKRYPEDPVAAKFVRAGLRNGTLEPASQAEWDEVHEDHLKESVSDDEREARSFIEAIDHVLTGPSGLQEAKLQKIVKERAAALRQSRDEAQEDYEDDEAPMERRKARVKEQSEELDTEDDPEAQAERNVRRSPKAKKAAAKRSTSSGSNDDDE